MASQGTWMLVALVALAALGGFAVGATVTLAIDSETSESNQISAATWSSASPSASTEDSTNRTTESSAELNESVAPSSTGTTSITPASENNSELTAKTPPP